jgi:ribonuclease HIII
MPEKNSFTFKLTPDQQDTLYGILSVGNYRPVATPYTRIAVKTPDVSVNLYTSGKCLVQGKGASDFVTFVMEPFVLEQATLGYEETVAPEDFEPHMGVDESGKGDFFGPLVIAAAYTDRETGRTLREMDVRDSKTIKSDLKAMAMGREIRRVLAGRFSLVKIGPGAYNRLYAKMRNVNTLLGWGHARAIENLLELVPSCPRAISDQFGRKEQVQRALMRNGRGIELIQRPKAESDIAVAAASILAREAFLLGLKELGKQQGVELPKGASAAVNQAAVALGKAKGPAVFAETAKCHFRTTDAVLAALGACRSDLGDIGAAVSKAARPDANP